MENSSETIKALYVKSNPWQVDLAELQDTKRSWKTTQPVIVSTTKDKYIKDDDSQEL